MKAMVKEYAARVRKILKFKLNGGNIATAINIWALALMPIASGTINCTKDEHEQGCL